MPSQLINPKRKIIADSSKTMFIWVAIMSAVVGSCVVVSIFLTQQIIFKAKVVNELGKTVSNLNYNNKVADELTENIRVLNTNQALNSIKANDSENALQVPLDALPADRNALALGASLQNVLLAQVDGLTIDSMTIDSENSTGIEGDDLVNNKIGDIPIQLQLTSSNASTIKDALTKLERSIRIIDIDKFILARSDTSYQATISAHAYYQPGVLLQLETKTITPGSNKK